jgi:hypothetical protein
MPMKAYCMASTTPHAYKVLMPQYACKPISVPCWSRLMWRRTLVLLHPLPCCHQHFTRGGLCLSPFCVCVCGGGGGKDPLTVVLWFSSMARTRSKCPEVVVPNTQGVPQTFAPCQCNSIAMT